MSENTSKRIVDFLFEIGTMKKLPRMHQQMLLTQDLSDNIASHSYRVAITAWFLAKMENADPYKVVMMALLHDTKEIRSWDHNYLHKKYVKIFEEQIAIDQLGWLPFPDLFEIDSEFEVRQSKEALIAKDADLLEQMMLLKEYEHQGSKEAAIWLSGKWNANWQNIQFLSLKTDSWKSLWQSILDGNVSEWWENIRTDKNH